MNETNFSIFSGSSSFIEDNSVFFVFNKESKYDAIETKFISYNFFNKFFSAFLPFSIFVIIY